MKKVEFSALPVSHDLRTFGVMTLPSLACSLCQGRLQPADRFCTSCGSAQFQVDQLPSPPGGSLKTYRYHTEQVRSPDLAGISDRGLWHSINEDAIAVDGLSGGRSALIVCDGVSSSEKPEQASAIAASTTIAALHHIDEQVTPPQALTQAIAQAQSAVCDLAPSAPTNPPATTIIAALLQPKTRHTLATIAWLGDSRAYWIAQTQAQLLTQDDSWMNTMSRSGKLTLSEAARSPYAHAITRWLGQSTAHPPSIVQLPLHQEGYLILCSDGFWNYVADPDQLSQICHATPIQPAISIAHQLVNHALACGGQDNISVAIYHNRPLP